MRQSEPTAGREVDTAFDVDLEVRKIVARNAEVARLEIKMMAAKDHQKSCKEAWDVASKELQTMISELGREYPW